MTQIEIEKKLISRIPKGWGKYISCAEGWYYILEDLEQKLSYLDPDYQIVQVKEKFGTLRFYYQSNKDKLVQDIMDDCVNRAEYYSQSTCEYCGSSSVRSISGKVKYNTTVKLREASWVKTACDECWTKKQEERKNRENALDELVKFNQENDLYEKTKDLLPKKETK